MPTYLLWAVKGGSGVTVVAAGLAATVARQRPVLLVDLDGDLPAVFGLDDDGRPGVAEWAAAPDPREDSLGRLVRRARPSVDLLVRGSGSIPDGVVVRLVQSLDGDGRVVVVDAGTRPDGLSPVVGATSVLVIRACYLALRRAARLEHRPDAVVLVDEPGRALDRRDVERVVGAPVVVSVDVDATVARRVDAGLLADRVPLTLRSLSRRLT